MEKIRVKNQSVTFYDWAMEDKGDVKENARRQAILKSYAPSNPWDVHELSAYSHTDVKWICPTCGRTYVKRLDHRTNNNRGCYLCNVYNTSVGEQILFKTLDKSLPGEVELHKYIERVEFDVCIEKYKLLIEYNGVYYHSTGDAMVLDREKRYIAKQHGYTLLTIVELSNKRDKRDLQCDFKYVLDSRKRATVMREFIAAYMKDNFGAVINPELTMDELRECYFKTKFGQLNDLDKKVIEFKKQKFSKHTIKLNISDEEEKKLDGCLKKLRTMGLIPEWR